MAGTFHSFWLKVKRMQTLAFKLKSEFKNEMVDLKEQLRAALALEWQPSFDGDLDYKTPPVAIHAQAGVLMLINAYQDDPHFILTQRTQNLRLHSGQVAFPGGKKDKKDATLWDAALRETQEEIGLPIAHPIEKLGALSHHITITGFEVTPFLALNPQPFAYQPEMGEVAAVFEVPMRLLRPENFIVESQDWKGQKRNYFVLPYDEYYIWGATARMLHQLASRLEYV